MKNIFKLYTILTLICVSFIVACSEDNSVDNEKTSEVSLRTPTNEILASSMDELSKNISENSNIRVTEINYWEVPKNIKGFVAEVDYLNEENEPKKVLIIRNIKKYPEILRNTKNN